MDSIFLELKKAREAKHLTLSDIADATLINMDFLQAIEQGNTAILPQTYIRAFIREYASVVGLDPNEVMRRYDEATKGGTTSAETKVTPKEAKPVTVTIAAGDTKSEPSTSKIPKQAIVALIVLIVGIGIWNLLRNETPHITKETPFESVVREKMQQSTSLEREPAVEPQPKDVPSTIDSLTLSAHTTDSVWIQLVIDNLEPQEYLFGPKQRISWKAREKFMLTLGNAGAMEFTLNGTSMGLLGKSGAVLRNVGITSESLPK